MSNIRTRTTSSNTNRPECPLHKQWLKFNPDRLIFECEQEGCDIIGVLKNEVPTIPSIVEAKGIILASDKGSPSRHYIAASDSTNFIKLPEGTAVNINSGGNGGEVTLSITLPRGAFTREFISQLGFWIEGAGAEEPKPW